MTMKSLCLPLAAAALAVLLSACAGADSRTDAKVADAGVVCDTDTQLGSSIARRNCHAPMTQEQRDAVERDITLRSQPKPIIKQ